MIRHTRRRPKLKLVRLASLAALLLVSVALLGFGVRQLLGFFAYPLEKVHSRPCSVLADGAEGVPSRHLVCAVDRTSGLCPAELTRPEPAGVAA